MAESDQALLNRWVLRRDAEALQEIVVRHSGMVYGVCRRILGNATDAEDVAQECFETLVQSGGKPGAYLGAWLHRVATNASLKHIRTEKRRLDREVRFASEGNHEEPIEWNEVYAHVDEAIAELPEKLRAPIVAHFLEGQTHEAVAEAVGLSRQAIAYRIKRGIEEVRKTLRRRDVHLGSAALAAMMSSELAEAAPAALTATLGRLALSGAGKSVATGVAMGMKSLAYGGAGVMAKKIVLGVAALVAVFILARHFSTRPAETPGGAPAPSSQSATVADTESASGPEEAPTSREEPDVEPAAVERDAVQTPTAVPEPTTAAADKAGLASVSGIVRDEQGGPFEGAQVLLFVYGDPMGYKVAARYDATAGHDGAYEIVGIDAYGAAEAHVQAEGHLPSKYRGHELDITPGAKLTDIDFTLRPGVFFIAGFVLSPGRRPIPEAAVRILNTPNDISNWGDGLVRALTDQRGYFQIAIPMGGVCNLTATKNGYGMGFFPGIATGTHDAILTLHPAGAIEGKVTWTNGSVAPGIVVEALGEQRIGENEDRHPELRSVRTDDQGRFRFDGLSQDLFYAVTARCPNPPPMPDNPSLQRREEMLRLSRTSLGEDSPSSRKRIVVKAGQTTRNVNLVITSTAVLYGTVSDTASGLPVHPLGVTAVVQESRARHWTTTGPDGSYRLELEIDQPVEVRIKWHYEHLGGSIVNGDVEDVLLRIKPGEEKKFDFNAPGSVAAPVRFEDAVGAPCTDFLARLRTKGTLMGTGEVDEDGRILLEGLPPDMTFQVLAVTPSDGHIVGTSEPLTGRPGETLPEATVVCAPHGGITGIVFDTDGYPVFNKPIRLRAALRDGSMSEIQGIGTDELGRFTISHALPVGTYPEVHIWYIASSKPDPNVPEDDVEAYMRSFINDYRLATVNSVEVAAGCVTDIGRVVPEPVAQSRMDGLAR